MQNEKQTIFCWLLNNILKHCASHKKLSDFYSDSQFPIQKTKIILLSTNNKLK